ncbi:MAG: polysaccharide biosynthesis C-terminal domain-containing protein, partial [Candidatus Sulfotelmatobacter sp.]
FIMAQAASSRILYGMARHRSLAWVTGMEAIANVILSVVLIRPFGIVGDALGTAIPLTCTGLFFLPRHLCRVLDVRVGTFLREAYSLPLLLCLPCVAVLLLMRQWFFARTYSEVALQILLSLIPYGLGMAWMTRTGRLWRVAQLSSGKQFDSVGVALMETFQKEP